MFDPRHLSSYLYRRNMCGSNPIDACSDVALFGGFSMCAFAQFLVTMGIDADRLSLLA